MHTDDFVYEDIDNDGTPDLKVKLSATDKMKSRFFPVVRPEVTINNPSMRMPDPNHPGQTVPEVVLREALGRVADERIDDALEMVRLLVSSHQPVSPVRYHAPLYIDQFCSKLASAKIEGSHYVFSKYIESAKIIYADGQASAHGLCFYLGYSGEAELRRVVGAQCALYEPAHLEAKRPSGEAKRPSGSEQLSDVEIVLRESLQISTATIQSVCACSTYQPT